MIFNISSGNGGRPFGTFNGIQFAGGSEVQAAGFHYKPIGATGWAIWITDTGELALNGVNPNADVNVCVVGAGGDSTASSYWSGAEYGDASWNRTCSNGGNGGEIVRTSRRFSNGEKVACIVSTAITAFGQTTGRKGRGAAGGAGMKYGSYGGTQDFYEGGSSGANGSYAFSDSAWASIDSTLYAPGGGGGSVTGAYSSGATVGARGAGARGSNNDNTGYTGTAGIIILWCKGV